jgi:hypothetical protein
MMADTKGTSKRAYVDAPLSESEESGEKPKPNRAKACAAVRPLYRPARGLRAREKPRLSDQLPRAPGGRYRRPITSHLFPRRRPIARAGGSRGGRAGGSRGGRAGGYGVTGAEVNIPWPWAPPSAVSAQGGRAPAGRGGHYRASKDDGDAVGEQLLANTSAARRRLLLGMREFAPLAVAQSRAAPNWLQREDGPAVAGHGLAAVAGQPGASGGLLRVRRVARPLLQPALVPPLSLHSPSIRGSVEGYAGRRESPDILGKSRLLRSVP